jgi:hypothetical protein
VSSKFKISRPLRGGYIISEALLRKCAQLVETFSGEAPRISLTFRDGRTVDSTDSDEVFGDSFIQSTRISEIKISAGNLFSPREASIIFRKYYDSPIYFIAEGDRSATLTLERDFLNELTSTRQWYSVFVLNSISFSILSTVFALISISLAIISVTVPYKRNDTLGFIMIIATSANILMFLILLFCRLEFPQIIFNIGHGARRQKLRIGIWSFIFLTVVAGMATISLHDLLTDWLKRLF